MTMALISLKKKHLAFLKKQLDEEEISDIKTYLNFCIKIIEGELNPKKYLNKFNYFESDPKVILNLELCGFDKMETEILSRLLANKSIRAVQFVSKDRERGKVYRCLSILMEKGIVNRTTSTITEYFILDKKNVFKNVVLSKQEEINRFNLVSKRIAELITEN